MANEEQKDVRQKENWGKRTSILEINGGEMDEEYEMYFFCYIWKNSLKRYC